MKIAMRGMCPLSLVGGLISIYSFSLPCPGCLGSCLHELSTALSTIFLTRLVLTNLHSILLASWTNEEKRKAEMEGVEPGAILTPAEREYAMEPYDGLMTTFRNFAELAVQYGYATLFAAAFPLSPIMAMLNNYIKIRYVRRLPRNLICLRDACRACAGKREKVQMTEPEGYIVIHSHPLVCAGWTHGGCA